MSVYAEAIGAMEAGNWKRLKQTLHHKGVDDPQNFFRNGLEHPFVKAVDLSGEDGVSPAVQIMLDSGFDPNLELWNEDDYLRGWRSIGASAVAGNLELTSFLISNGAKLEWPHARDTATLPPLAFACLLLRKGPKMRKIVDLLIESGAPLNPKSSPPPLHCVAASGLHENGVLAVDAARTLIDAGADPNFMGKISSMNGNADKIGPPLFAYWAAGVPLVQFLLENGADPMVQASTGENMIEFFKRYSKLVERSEVETAEVSKILGMMSSVRTREDATVVEDRQSGGIWKAIGSLFR